MMVLFPVDFYPGPGMKHKKFRAMNIFLTTKETKYVKKRSVLFYTVTTVLILTLNVFFMETNMAERLFIVGFPDFDNIRWRLLLGF